ncbi:hypothetical protein CNMCM6936_002632 [Aspergillus lentulus]|uniref:Uncharacterized protein n=1 Tax=Aspergillus lentulus TaxID=293939 RepID=A0AAN6BNW0_ASPLE|nr:hypothetical protein CNMCM6069_005856 [Aspergillus lentulus]KAF4162062.1 hypothetical protein CNMCM6936_002632 [Aspergillus lentulus]KAF4171893.1 hypothetical protein CNMCM8060_002279 [Aspergillus lentulus]KAF4191541.1 hypothetical protein CNMCM8694_001728 [Aspergillus lentulus]KAF4204764.1 hypothetical protein CNMCM8927_007033 [Aspergillus lentulus]
MNNAETAEFLYGLEGTDVTLDPPSEPPFHLSRQTWVIDKKLSERSQWMTQQVVTDCLGLLLAAAKILCYRKENPSKKAFMRIYLQIPKALKILECDVVPDLLRYQEGKQGEDGIIRGVISLMWSGIKSHGEPLSEEEFWELDLESRQAICDQFREAYPKLRKCGYLPRMPTMSKIIYDKATGNMHFSGFSCAGRTDTKEEWHDKYYVLFELAEPSPKTDWVKDTRGWTW